MNHPNNQHDTNDLVGISGTVTSVEPCPIKDGKISPNVTRVTTSDGVIHDVVHIKPIYYEHKDGGFRPMAEIAEEFGNHYCKLNSGWRSKASKGFIKWYAKRMDIVNANKGDELTLQKDASGNPTKTVPSGLSESREVGRGESVETEFVKLSQEDIDNFIN
jgi:hypothetical protein